MDLPDNDEGGDDDRSKTNKTRINITTDVNGGPELPSITMADGYHTKGVQAALRAYCTAHIREQDIHSIPGYVISVT
jgi:hypothetical protein